MPANTMNEDLKRERQRCSFDPKELTYLLDGGEEKTEERRQRGEQYSSINCPSYSLVLFPEKFFLDDPELSETAPSDYLSHKEKYEHAVKKACIVFKKVQQLQAQGKAGMQNFR